MKESVGLASFLTYSELKIIISNMLRLGEN